MLLSQVIYSHGAITNLPIRTTIQPSINPIGAVYTGASTNQNVSIASGAVKTAAQMSSNLASVGTVYTDATPCRYNDNWNATNALTAGSQVITWNVTETHPNSTCVFNWLKDGKYAGPLSEPFACAAQLTSGESHTVIVPPCAASDKCTIQWYWSADLPIAQFLNCIDFTATLPGTNSTHSGSQQQGGNFLNSLVLLVMGFLY